MQHHSFFADKYLGIKMEGYDLKKEVSNLDEKKVAIQNWIKKILNKQIDSQKEEAIQADFLNIFFGDVLGYDYSSPENWLLEKEVKTPLDGTKADGGLGYFKNIKGKKDYSDVRVAIELKDARTNLDKPQNRKNDKRTPVEQAFGYANKFGESCKWVVVSNFKEIRLYNKQLGQARYEAWNIIDLSNEKDLKRFFFLLNHDRLFTESIQSPIQHLFETRQAEEEEISKEFYAKYKVTRIKLFAHIREQNPSFDELELFSKAQKLLDRIIFICFCEDFNIIPYYTFRKLLKAIKGNVFEVGEDKVYKGVKALFKSIDMGNSAANINRFNGGLFAPDTVLDNLIIKDDILEPVILLSDYDFATDLNVNILGHIFEQSISDIEEIKANIQGGAFDETKGKRKKEGIFYTPEYITRYIVDNAVGGWLNDQKTKLGEEKLPELTNDDYGSIKTTKKGVLSTNTKIKKHINFWESYKDKLQNIKIVDPACGSGAFLNQVFDYLYKEGQIVNSELARLNGGQRDIFDLNKHILSNNIYGVDLNTESVQITKLSLWLKTANNRSELTALDQNIKIGNSLIDDPKVAGDKAFSWEEEFSEIFKNGGFDVVVGNPPYVRIQNIDKESVTFFNDKYTSPHKNYDIYILFVEILDRILNSHGLASYIMPTKFINSNYGLKLKSIISNKRLLNSYLDFADFQIFQDATTYTGIFVFGKKNKDNFKYYKVTDENQLLLTNIDYSNVPYTNLESEKWIFLNTMQSKLFAKLDSISKLSSCLDTLFVGLQTSADPVFILKKKGSKLYSKFTKKEYDFDSKIIKPLLKGAEITRYSTPIPSYYLIFPYLIENDGFHLISEKEMKKEYQKEWDYLNECSEKLKNRENGRMDIPEWYGYVYKKNMLSFDKPKLLTQVLCKKSSLTIDLSNKFYFVGGGTAGGYGISITEPQKIPSYTLLAILNSRLIQWYIQLYASPFKGGFYAYNKSTLNEIPISLKAINNNEFENIVKKIISDNDEINSLVLKISRQIKRKFKLEVLSRKLQNWHTLTFAEFVEELEKKKIKLGLGEEGEWEVYFEAEKVKVQAIQTSTDRADKEIDKLVYQLYDLTEEEIQVIESSFEK